MLSYVVNVSMLENGKIFKNYRALCESMCWKVGKPSNDVGKSQLNELSRFCDYERKGQKIIINEVYKIPLKKIENRGGNNNELIEINENTMIHILSLYSYKKDQAFYLSKTRLFNLLGFINEEYIKGRNNAKKVIQDLKVTNTAYNYFYHNTYVKYKSSLERLLKYMENKRVLTYTEEIMVYNKEDMWRAGEDDLIKILDIETEVLKRMELDGLKSVFIKNKANEFYSTVKYEMSMNGMNIDGYCKSYRIIVNSEFKKQIEDDVKKMNESGMTFDELRKIMNEKLLNKNIKMFENKSIKMIDEAWGVPQEKWKRDIIDKNNFVKDGEKLFNNFCLLNDENKDIYHYNYEYDFDINSAEDDEFYNEW